MSNEGYEFVNWNTAEDGSGIDYNPGATYSADSSITLYAQWNKILYSFDRVVLEGVEYDYTGEAVTPLEKVYNSFGKLLQKDEDYTVSYENNINVGVATITINGIGPRYNGQQLTTSFAITGINFLPIKYLYFIIK